MISLTITGVSDEEKAELQRPGMKFFVSEGSAQDWAAVTARCMWITHYRPSTERERIREGAAAAFVVEWWCQ